MAEEMVLVPGAVFGFLVGEAPLEGCWFGDHNPTRKGAFWWRSVLRETVRATPPPPTEGAEIVERLLQACADSGPYSSRGFGLTGIRILQELLQDAATHITTQEAELTRLRHREQSIAPYREALEKIRDGKIEAMMMAAAKAHDANVTERETGAASALRCANGIATPYWRAIVQAVIRSHQKIARTAIQQGAK